MLYFMEYLTKWLEVFAVADEIATTIARLLVEEIARHHGVSTEILSDRGRSFLSSLVKEMVKLLGIHISHMPYLLIMPVSNNQLENICFSYFMDGTQNCVVNQHCLCNIANTCMYACILYDAPRMHIPFIVIFLCCNYIVMCACNNHF